MRPGEESCSIKIGQRSAAQGLTISHDHVLSHKT